MPFGNRPSRDLSIPALPASGNDRVSNAFRQSSLSGLGKPRKNPMDSELSPMPFGNRPSRDTKLAAANEICRQVSPMPFGNRPSRDLKLETKGIYPIKGSPMPFGNRPSRDWNVIRNIRQGAKCLQCLSAIAPLGTHKTAHGILQDLAASPMPFGNRPSRDAKALAMAFDSNATVSNAFRQSPLSGQQLMNANLEMIVILSPMPFGNRPSRDSTLLNTLKLSGASPQKVGRSKTRA